MAWNKVCLRHIASEVQTGPFGSQLHSDEYVENGVPVINPSNIRTGCLVSDSRASVSAEKAAELSRHALRSGDLIFARRGELGRSAVVSEGAAGWLCGTGALRVRLRPGLVEQNFMAYAIQSATVRGYFEQLAVGSTMENINSSIVLGLPIALPPLEEQRRIADFLDVQTARIDLLIQKFDRQKFLLQEREQAFLLLGVAGARLGQGSLSTGISWLPLMHPKASLVTLGRLLQLQRGVDLPENERRLGSIPVITTAGPSGMHDTAIACGPGVVIGRYGTVGNVHWVDEPYWPHNTTLYVKNFNNSDPRYCYHLLRALPYEMEQARSAVPGVNRNDLHRQRVVLLPRDLQVKAAQQLDDEAEKCSATHERLQRAKALLEERRRALITAAVTGELDVTTARGV